MPVEYDNDAWERRLQIGFEKIAAEYQRFVLDGRDSDKETARLLSLGGLARATGMVALATKESRWAEECEWRQVALPARERPIKLVCSTRANGSQWEYLMLPMHVPGRLLVLDEVIIGPKEDQTDAEIRIRGILTAAGYPSGDASIPSISRSRFAAR